MVNFSHIAPSDRWAVLETTLNQLMVVKERGTPISPTSLIDVQDLASRAGVSESTMRKSLSSGGAQPFRMGKGWFVREINLVSYYENQERNAAKTRD